MWPCWEALEDKQVSVIIHVIIQFLDAVCFPLQFLFLQLFKNSNFRLSNLSSFQRFWLTKADYQENGPVMEHDTSKIFEDIKNSNTELAKA